MKWFILLAFIGVFLVKNAIPSKTQRHPSRLEWLFGLNNKQDENKQDENKEEDKPTICQTQECKKIARIISESINKAVDPCDNFYEYACGKWPEHNPIPKGTDSWSMFESAQTNVVRQIKEIFDEGAKKDDLLAVKLAKKWYTICMDTDAIERHGLEPLVFTLSRIGGWPLIMEPDEWNEEEYSWQKVDDQYVRLTGRNTFHDVRVIEDSSNETEKVKEKVVHIDIPHLPPGSYRLWGSTIDSEEEKDKSDEDPSDEEKPSNEQKDSQEPGSESKDENDKSGNNSNNSEDDNNDDDEDEDDSDDDDEDDSNDDDEDEDDSNDDDEDDSIDDDEDDEDSDINEQNDDDNAKKKVAVKKPGKFAKNKKLGHSRKMKSSTHSKKSKNKIKKEKIKKRAIPTNVSKKLRVWKKKRNHEKQERRERLKKTLEVTEPHISTEETIDEDDWLKQYANYISKVAHAVAKVRGVEVAKKHMDKDIQDMIEFHLKLVDVSVNDIITSDEESESEDEITLNDFQEWYDKKNPKTRNSAIDWLYKIGELFDEAHVPIGGDVNVEIGSPNYFESLVALLDETSSRTIVNYIHWNFLSRIIRTTTSEMRKLYNAWELKEENDDKEILGVSTRAFKCTREVEMSDIIAYEYVKNHFPDKVIATASDMLDDIQKEVEYQIKDSDWMDEDTKDFILAKLVNMDKFIGYPDWYKNNTIVKQYLQGLVIGNSYYENTLSYNRYSKWKSLRKLSKNDEDDDLTISPLIVNAFFSPDNNFIALSAADFQSPLFAYGRPQVINYGIIGSIIGHEVNHGFDDSGHLYDKNGEEVEWLSAMAEAYGKRAECFVEQFNNYHDKTSNLKTKTFGNLTAGENIADTMGLEAAFKAYKRRERECEKSGTVLPGHEDVTDEQLFFLSFANLWCEAVETNSTINKGDVHSPGRLRVIGSVSNSQDFAEAYNCAVGSPMNPEKKCHIWK